MTLSSQRSHIQTLPLHFSSTHVSFPSCNLRDPSLFCSSFSSSLSKVYTSQIIQGCDLIRFKGRWDIWLGHCVPQFLKYLWYTLDLLLSFEFLAFTFTILLPFFLSLSKSSHHQSDSLTICGIPFRPISLYHIGAHLSFFVQDTTWYTPICALTQWSPVNWPTKGFAASCL